MTGVGSKEAAPRREAGQQDSLERFEVSLYSADGHLRRLAEIEGEVIRLAVVMYRGRTSEIARRLRVGRSTIYRKLDELGIRD